MGHTLVHADDPAIETFRGVFFKIRRALGTTAFGINELRLPPGPRGLEHDERETGHEEVYIVLDGDGTFMIDGTSVEVSPGDYLRVTPDAVRVVTAGPGGLGFMVVAARPQQAYDGRDSL